MKNSEPRDLGLESLNIYPLREARKIKDKEHMTMSLIAPALDCRLNTKVKKDYRLYGFKNKKSGEIVLELDFHIIDANGYGIISRSVEMDNTLSAVESLTSVSERLSRARIVHMAGRIDNINYENGRADAISIPIFTRRRSENPTYLLNLEWHRENVAVSWGGRTQSRWSLREAGNEYEMATLAKQLGIRQEIPIRFS